MRGLGVGLLLLFSPSAAAAAMEDLGCAKLARPAPDAHPSAFGHAAAHPREYWVRCAVRLHRGSEPLPITPIKPPPYSDIIEHTAYQPPSLVKGVCQTVQTTFPTMDRSPGRPLFEDPLTFGARSVSWRLPRNGACPAPEEHAYVSVSGRLGEREFRTLFRFLAGLDHQRSFRTLLRREPQEGIFGSQRFRQAFVGVVPDSVQLKRRRFFGAWNTYEVEARPSPTSGYRLTVQTVFGHPFATKLAGWIS